MSISPRFLGDSRARRFFLYAKLALSLLLSLGFPSLFSGCSSSDSRADIVIVNGQEPESLDPVIGTGVEDTRITSALFEGLVRRDPKTGHVIPGLAQSWKISPDGKRYTFCLRSKLRWTEKDAITSEDLVYSWLRLLDPRTASPCAGHLFYLTNAEEFNSGKIVDPAEVGIRALDPQIVEVELKAPTPFFLELCAEEALAVVPRKLVETHGDRWIMSVHPLPTSGPFCFDSWKLGDRIRIRKNPYYWDAAHTRSETIDFFPIGMPSTALNLYERGYVDIIWDKDNLPPELLSVLKMRPDFHTCDYLATYFLRFNTTRFPFNDARVRKALGMAIDRKRIVERILQGSERAATRLVPEGMDNYQPIDGVHYDPESARRLLAEAGFPNGHKFPAFQYLLDSSGGAAKIHLKIAVEIQGMWQRELGVRTELRQMEKKVYLAAQNRLEYEVARSSWLADYNDPNTFLDVFRSNNANNRTGWANSRYDELMRLANYETDIPKRMALLREAETILIEKESAICPIYHYAGFNFFDPQRIEGIYQNLSDVHPLNYVARRAKQP